MVQVAIAMPVFRCNQSAECLDFVFDFNFNNEFKYQIQCILLTFSVGQRDMLLFIFSVYVLHTFNQNVKTALVSSSVVAFATLLAFKN